MKKIKFACLALSMLGVVASLTSCDRREKVVIWTSTEDYNVALMKEKFAEKFPEYNIIIEEMSTSTIAQRVKAEKEDSSCDIVFCEEYGYMEMLIEAGALDSIEGDYDISRYTEKTVPSTTNKYVLPCLMTGGGVIVNNKVLNDRGLAKPHTYAELLSPAYKDLICMANPTSSGTGYMFYYSLVKAWGEQQAVAYFTALKGNVVDFTSSGSGPVNKLVGEEVAVGFGMISQAVNKINGGNSDLEILFFNQASDPGAPYNLYGNGIVKGKKARTTVIDDVTRNPVKEVMDYLDSYYTNESCSRFYPEPVFKGAVYSVENFPTNIPYADMTGNNLTAKDHLNTVWNETVMANSNNN